MDISTMTIEQLKSLAYDELVKVNTANRNIQMLELRIAELQKQAEPKSEATVA